MKEDPGSSARRLVLRARGRAFRHGAGRALLRGLSVGAALAAVLAAGAWILGERPGPWLSVALVPGIALAVHGLFRARPTLVGAALLLDRAADSRERFVTALEAKDEEVRDLVARQAVEGRDPRRLPLSFPPSTEGLVAALSIALLAGVLLLAFSEDEEERSAGPGGPTVSAGAAAPPGGGEAKPEAPADRRPAADSVTAPVPDAERLVDRLASGDDLTEEEWRAIEELGVPREEIDSARATAELAGG
ncbi:MAG: hypothetical protein ACYTDY_12755, partial [Planctomycetota bacterium]